MYLETSTSVRLGAKSMARMEDSNHQVIGKMGKAGKGKVGINFKSLEHFCMA